MASNVAWARCHPLGSQKAKDLRFVVKVVATELGAGRGCGVPGKDVIFRLGDTALTPSVPWDNRRPTEQNLRPEP